MNKPSIKCDSFAMTFCEFDLLNIVGFTVCKMFVSTIFIIGPTRGKYLVVFRNFYVDLQLGNFTFLGLKLKN